MAVPIGILNGTMPGPTQSIPTDRAEIRRRLEDVAAQLFAEQGYDATTVDQIVARAEVSKPALYRHFESKKDLYMTLLQRHREELTSVALAEVRADVSIEAALPGLIDAWFAHVEQHPYTWRMLFRNTTGDADIEAVHAEMHRAQVMADVMLLRLVDPPLPEEQLEPLGEVMRASLASLALWWLKHPHTSRSVLVDTMVRVAQGVLASTQMR